MLYEYKDVRQLKNEGKRRWFTDNFFDLYLWYDQNDVLIGFQLCYDKSFQERAVTWKKDGSFLHNKIDDGETQVGTMKQTPILVQDGQFDNINIAQRFKEESKKLEPQLAEFIHQKILEYKV